MRDSSRCGWCDLGPAARSTLIWGHVPALHVSPSNLIGAPILIERTGVMSTAEGTYSRTGAEFDPTGVYRYSLWREWDARAPAVAFVMLNPSTADAARDDPTIRRCASFARSWGYGSLEVVNLFAYRASEPKRLRQTPDPIGPANDDYLVDAADRVQTVVVAWGVHGTIMDRGLEVFRLLAGRSQLHCLGFTQAGQPRHPLYIRRETVPVPFQ